MKRLIILFLSLACLALCDFYVGMFQKNDKLVAQDRVYKEKIPYRIQYAKYGRVFKCLITYLRVVDRLGYGRGPKTKIIRGGLRKKFVVLRLSAYNSPISVNIYVGCDNKPHKTTRTTKVVQTKTSAKTTTSRKTTSSKAKTTSVARTTSKPKTTSVTSTTPEATTTSKPKTTSVTSTTPEATTTSKTTTTSETSTTPEATTPSVKETTATPTTEKNDATQKTEDSEKDNAEKPEDSQTQKTEDSEKDNAKDSEKENEDNAKDSEKENAKDTEKDNAEKKLGEPCENALECNHIDNAECVATESGLRTDKKCTCKAGFKEESNKCIANDNKDNEDNAKKKLGDKCEDVNECKAIDNVECATKPNESENKCTCIAGYKDENDLHEKCIAKVLGDACKDANDCKEIETFAYVECKNEKCACTDSGEQNGEQCVEKSTGRK